MRLPGDPYGPRREAGTNARARGASPRQLGTNPRRLGTNPSAGTPADRARVHRLRRRAVAILHVAGDVWCETCNDETVVDTGAGFAPCPDHRLMTSNEADDIVNRRRHPHP